MKKIFFALCFLSTMTFAHAEETIGEKTEAKVNDAKRAIKKGVHRTGEKFCAKGDVECLKERAQNRTEEAGDYMKDKTKEMKNKVDSN